MQQCFILAVIQEKVVQTKDFMPSVGKNEKRITVNNKTVAGFMLVENLCVFLTQVKIA